MMIFATAFLSFGCHSKKDLITHNGADNYLIDAATLKVAMDITPVNNSQEVYLTFTVTNNSNQEVRFVKWETPFEPRLGKYFEIVDNTGNEALFKGAMARRVMPPPAGAYITVKPHDKVSTRINLADNYTFNGNSYQLKYVGGGVSGLQTGKSVKFTVSH
ncbi:MAG: hypothetical protein ACTHMI_09725 [Mucilaginibacter sp.]